MDKSPSTSRRLSHLYVPVFSFTALFAAFHLGMENPATGTWDVVFGMIFIFLIYTFMGYLFFVPGVLLPYLIIYRWLPSLHPISMPVRLGACSAAILFVHALLVYFAPTFLANEHTDQICRVCTHAWGYASLVVLLFLLVSELRNKAESTDTTDDF